MKSKKLYYILQVIIGVIILTIGGFVLTSEEVKMFSGLCFGIGSAMTALGIGWLIQSIIVPAAEIEKMQKQKEIEVKDERNTRIREKAGFMVAKIMNYLLSAFILVLGFMGVDKQIIIMVASLILIELILSIYFSNYYAKNM